MDFSCKSKPMSQTLFPFLVFELIGNHPQMLNVYHSSFLCLWLGYCGSCLLVHILTGWCFGCWTVVLSSQLNAHQIWELRCCCVYHDLLILLSFWFRLSQLVAIVCNFSYVCSITDADCFCADPETYLGHNWLAWWGWQVGMVLMTAVWSVLLGSCIPASLC